MRRNVGQQTSLEVGNVAGIIQWIPIFDKPWFQGCNTGRICNGLLMDQGTNHLCPVMPKSPRYPHPCTRWLCILVVLGDTGSSRRGHLGFYADIAGFIRDARMRFRVSLICGVSLSHSWRGNSLSVVANAAMNASLKVCIACSAALI